MILLQALCFTAINGDLLCDVMQQASTMAFIAITTLIEAPSIKAQACVAGQRPSTLRSMQQTTTMWLKLIH